MEITKKNQTQLHVILMRKNIKNFQKKINASSDNQADKKADAR